MQAVQNSLIYDTDLATRIRTFDFINEDADATANPEWRETLYRTERGNYFVHSEYFSAYYEISEPVIEPYSMEEACDWYALRFGIDEAKLNFVILPA